jgi:tetratricopeptide (TPR) repeat protein
MTSLTRASIVFALLTASLALAAPARHQSESRIAVLYRESYMLEAKLDYPGALAKVREIRQSGGASYFATLRTAWLSYLAGDYKASAADYADAIAAEPKAVEPKLGLTLPLLAGRNWRELERACRDVLAIDARNVTARSRLAQALYWAGNYPDAASTYRQLVADYPSDLDHKTGLGWALLRMGRTAEARQIFGSVLAVSPDNVYAKQGLAAQ